MPDGPVAEFVDPVRELKPAFKVRLKLALTPVQDQRILLLHCKFFSKVGSSVTVHSETQGMQLS
jgi:hypothetical protein